MPKNPRKSGARKNRKVRQPNVFAQSEPTGPGVDATQAAVTTASTDSAPRVRARVERTTRRASARSEIYTRSLTAELKKMGALASVVAVTLVVLAFVL